MEVATAPWTPDHAVQVTLERRRYPDPNAERVALMNILERIEWRIDWLWKRLNRHVERNEDPFLQALINLIREDEKVLISLCISHVDRGDPELDILHDRTNNDTTLSLHEKLAVAAKFNCVKRVMYLHHLQKKICERLKELGINVSRN